MNSNALDKRMAVYRPRNGLRCTGLPGGRVSSFVMDSDSLDERGYRVAGWPGVVILVMDSDGPCGTGGRADGYRNPYYGLRYPG